MTLAHTLLLVGNVLVECTQQSLVLAAKSLIGVAHHLCRNVTTCLAPCDEIIEKLRNNIKDLKTDAYEKPTFKELLQDAVIDYIRKLKSQEALYESKLHIQKSINKLLGKELAELKAKLSEDLNKSS